MTLIYLSDRRHEAWRDQRIQRATRLRYLRQNCVIGGGKDG